MSCDHHNFLTATDRRRELEISDHIDEPQNMKYVQTAFSATDMEPIRSKLNRRSYSEEEIGDNSRRYNRKELKEEILEWIDVYNDKLKVKLLREKMQKLAEKLGKPGEEEWLRMKIEKYLRRVPSLSDCDEDKTEFRRQLPNNILRRLKKMYAKSDENSLSRMESLKFYSNVKTAVMNWLVTIPIKRQDFLGKTVKKDDIFNYLSGQLKSVIIDRPVSDIDYKNMLKSSIVNTMEALPIDDHKKNCKLADDLANDILNISTTFLNKHVQPTLRELKEFISDEINYFVEKSHINMNTKRMKYLEAELVDALIRINNTDEIVADDVCKIFRDIGKIPVYKARYMTDIILNDYKDYFFRNDNNSEKMSSNVYSVYQNATSMPVNNKTLVNKLIDEIYDWLHGLPLSHTHKEGLNRHFIKDLAATIAMGISKGDPDVIDTEVSIWLEKVFKGRLHTNVEEQLKDRLENVPYEVIVIEKDPKHERLIIRRYEDIIDEWLDKVLIETRNESSFFYTRNERIHDLAIKLYNIKAKLNRFNEIVTRTLQDEILDWMKTIPFNKQNNSVISAAKLVEKINACDINNMKDIEIAAKLGIRQLEEVLLDWLKKLPLYRNKSTKNKEIMELIMTKLADKLHNSVKDTNLNPNTEIIEYVRMLDTNQNDEFVQDTALKLKRYLQELRIFENILQHEGSEDQFLVANVTIWLKYLPFDPKLVKNLESRKAEFVGIIKHLRFWGANDDILKDEIIKFLMSLPLTHINERFLTEEAMKLIQNLTTTIGDVPRKLTFKSYEIIEDTVKDWCKKLPLSSEYYNPRELHYLIDSITTQIIKLQLNPEDSYTDGILRREIIKNLMKFPLKPAYSSDDNIQQMANDLIVMLKDVRYKAKSNVAVYGVSLDNANTTDTDFSIKSINNDDIKSNLDNYAKQLVEHINEWLQNLDVPNIREQSFKEVVINDLAGDIIDRHKYLELNPRSKGTEAEELEHLKYQIFKWINKLVGEDNLVTIDHASDLMNRIQSVPVPTLVKPQEKVLLSPSESIESRSLKQSQNTLTNNEDHKIDSSIKESVEVAAIRSVINSDSFKEQHQKSRRLNSEGDLGLASQPISANTSSQNEILRQATSNPGELGKSNTASQNKPNTLPKIYDKYQKIFIEKSNEIVNAAIPNDKLLADMAQTEIYKGILNGFFTLKSNPDIENDYACFEFMLEDKVDELIDLLPHTTELDSVKHNWKISVLINAVEMLKEMHSVTDRPTFRHQLTNRLNRKALKDLEDKECFGLQQGFLVEMANDYILETRYKQDDPIKSNIYKQRLMKKLDDFANHITKEHKLGFKYINRVALKRLAMKVLDEVPIPANDILQEEVEEILLAEEIQRWYKELPTYPYLNDMDVLLRKRLIDILARKLKQIDKNMPQDDPSKERLMKHEMTMFLERKGKLQRDQDLNINFMVDELNNRLKNRWIDRPTEYEAFYKDNPVSSTFAQYENDEILAPVEAARGSNTVPTQSFVMPNDHRSYTDMDGAANFQNCQPRNAHGHIPATTSQIYPHKGYYSNQEDKDGILFHEDNSGYRSYNGPQANGDRSCNIDTNITKGYSVKPRNEMPSEDEGVRGRCRCNLRRSYVCYDCEDYHRYVPCRYYI